MDIIIKLLFVILLALLPSFFWLRVFLKEDYREAEPRKLLAVLFILGIIAGLVSLAVEIIISYIFFGNIVFMKEEYNFDGMWLRNNFFKLFIFIIFVPSITEEFFKCSVVKKFGMESKYFNQIIDGMIYAVVVALGFAFLENYIYFKDFFKEGADALTGGFILRFLSSTLLHAFATGTFGYYVAKAKFMTPQSNEKGLLNSKQKYLIKGFILAFIIHLVFNFLLVIGLGQYAIIILIFIGVTFFEKMRSSEAQSFWYLEKKNK